MVVQKTIDNLKDRPKDERKAVAGGIAITLVVVLLIAWAFLFFKRIQSGSQQINFDTGAQGEFDFSNVREAQAAIEAQGRGNTNDLYRIRDDAAAGQVQGAQELYIQQVGGGDVDAFGNPTSNY